MPKFKVGDIVKLNCPRHGDYDKSTARILEISQERYEIRYLSGKLKGAVDTWGCKTFEAPNTGLGASLHRNNNQYPEWF